MEYNKELCAKEHKYIDERLDKHDDRLNEHTKQLDGLCISSATHSTEIKNLCKEISSLVTTIKWFIGLMMGAFVGFFFYAAQRGLIK